MNVEESTDQTYSEIGCNEQFQNTPIWIRKHNDKGYFATMGNGRISDFYDKKSDLLEDITFADTKTIIQICATMIDAALTLINEENKKEKPCSEKLK